jgi:hypothetical protein
MENVTVPAVFLLDVMRIERRVPARQARDPADFLIGQRDRVASTRAVAEEMNQPLRQQVGSFVVQHAHLQTVARWLIAFSLLVAWCESWFEPAVTVCWYLNPALAPAERD